MEDAARGSPRELNKTRVLAALRTLGETSRAEVARRTGLSRSTVSSIVGELLDAGLVSEREGPVHGAVSRGGRPPTTIALDPAAGVAVGIDFGKRHLAVAAGDLGHTVLAETRRDMEEDYTAADGMRQAEELVGAVLEDAGIDRTDVLGVGMGLPGPVHRPTGTIGSATILPGWAGVRLLEEMQALLGLPVYVDNDANLGALSELFWGAGRGCSNFAYLKVATGIGAGLIFDGHVLQGAGGTAGEIGHVSVDDDGDICRCGSRGCLETVAAAPAIVRMLQRGLGDSLEPEQVIERAQDGDLACRRALADAARHIGGAVATLCNLFNPERIVVGGTMGGAGDLLLDPLRESVQLRAIQSAAEDVEIVPGQLGERAELLGAVALVLQETSPIAAGRTKQPRGGIDAR